MQTCNKIVALTALAAIIAGPTAPAQQNRTAADDASTLADTEISVDAGNVVGMAIGEGASVNTRIGGVAAHGKTGNVKVRIGRVYRQAVGPGATVNIDISSQDDD